MKNKTKEELELAVGKRATLKKMFRCPGQSGACKIVALSRRGPGRVIVEWDEDGDFYPLGAVGVMLLSSFDLEEEDNEKASN